MTKMIFRKSDESRIVVWPVTVNKPIDGGQTIGEQLDVKFAVLPADRIAEAAAAGDRKLFDLVVTGFSDLVDEKGHPADDRAAREMLFGLSYARRDIIDAYFSMMAGRAEKN